jgi:hypothetical protein
VVRTIKLSRLWLTFRLRIWCSGLSWCHLLGELLWLLGVLCRFILLRIIALHRREIIIERSRLFLRPILSSGLSNTLFVGMLRIYRLGLHLNLRLELLVYWLMIEITSGWVRILISTWLGRRRNFLVENSRENILVLLLLRQSLWDIVGA